MDEKITPNTENIPELDPKKVLLEISKKGFIKSLRKGDTGIGYTLETGMGIKENNIPHCDFLYKGKPVELKAQRKDTGSNITLFTKEPKWYPLKPREIIEKYGYTDIKGRPGLKVTLKLNIFNNKDLALQIGENGQKLNIVHKKDDIICYFWIRQLMWSLRDKLAENLLIVLAERKREKDVEYFHYVKAYLLSELSEEKFKKLLEEGKIVFEFRMHSKPSDATRSHGSGFRLNERHISELYAKKEVML